MLCFVFSVLSLLIFARVVASWLPPPAPGIGSAAIGALERVTDVVLKPVRRSLPAVRLGSFGLDLSPMIVLVVLAVLTRAFC